MSGTQLTGAGVQVLLQDELALQQLLIVMESEALLQDGQRVVQPLQLLPQSLQLPHISPQTSH